MPPAEVAATEERARAERRGLRDRFSVWVLGVTALAIAAVFRNGPSEYVPDARFEQLWNPSQRISRSLAIWDSSRGLGRVREDLWPGATLPIWVFRSLGASPALAEHLWHAALLAAAGVGAVAVVRLFRPRLALEHALAALVYMFGPFSASFLIPSNLYFHYALTPWLIVVAYRGLHAAGAWRWAAAFALLIFAAGNLDTPGLLYGLTGVGLVAVYTVVVERGVRWRHLLRWTARAGVLSLVVSAAAISKTIIGARSFDQRLQSTETPDVIGAASSWSESLRGLGAWQSYFIDSHGPVRPQGGVYFTNVAVILATFIVPVAALALLGIVRRWRGASLLAALMLTGAFLMVGAHPPADPPPWGRLWLWMTDHVAGVDTLRSTYKAGSLYAIGTAALFGVGVALGYGALADRSRRIAACALALGVLVAASTPFWQGDLYDGRHLDAIPDYWEDAIAWLDDEPGDQQVLFLPGATRALYRWGAPGDDIHDALLQRPHASNIAVTLSTPLATDALEAIDVAAADPSYVTGSIGPVLQRLGIGYVVIRNDLDWQRMGVARPARYEQLRGDDDLELVATFGEEGEHTVGTVDTDTGRERDLPPVEIYRVDGDPQRSRAAAARGWLLHDGSASGWFTMARDELLDDGAPIVSAALLDDATLVDSLDASGRYVVTDSNRRQAQALTVYAAERSRTLAADEDLDRPTTDLYGVEGSQSVASYRDARVIDDPGLFRSLVGFRPQYRPAQAFDGDRRTGWVVPPLPDPRTRSLRVQLTEPRMIGAVDLLAFDRSTSSPLDGLASLRGVARIGRAAIELSDGSVHHVNLIAGRAVARFPRRETTSIEIRILDVTDDRDVGIAEVSFPGTDLDLLEHVRMPDSVVRRAVGDADLKRALDAAPATYLMHREVGSGATPVEPQLRRELHTISDRRFEIHGVLSRPAQSTRPSTAPDECVDVGLTIDDSPVAVRFVGAPVDDAGVTHDEFEACDAVALDRGWHRVAGTDAIIDSLSLDAPAAALPVGPDPTLDSANRGATTREWRVDAPRGALVVSGDGFDERWRATEGADDPAPLPADAQNAWLVPRGREVEVLAATFGPARAHTIALGVTLIGLVACAVALALGRQR